MNSVRIGKRAVTVPEAIQIGLGHHQAGELPEAERAYEGVLAVDPDNPAALYLLGLAAHQQGRPGEAIASYDRALTIRPDHAEALCNRGVALFDLSRYEEAVASFDRSLAINPGDADALNNRGSALKGLKRYDKALASYEMALALDSDSAETWNNRGLVLQALERYEEALASFERVLALKPAFIQALSSRGHALQGLGRYDEAIASYEKALAADPHQAEALSNRGNAMKELGRYDEALASYDRALKILPGDATAHWNRSLVLLVTGDFERGWKEFEWRWKWDAFPSARPEFAQPLWLGDADIAGKTILLHAEQGLGDTIQFVRYTQAVARKDAKVILEVQPALKALLSSISGAHQVLGKGEPLPAFDFHCPLLSLPLAFNTRLDTIPAAIPYLGATVSAVRKWEDRLGLVKAPRIGIAWAGSPSHRNDRNRSIASSELMGLENLGVALVSLQKEVRAEDEQVLAANRKILHFGSELEDFSDTAALVSLMDLVISVDTSVAHLAGALGKPVWILLPFSPDWRWLAGRKDSPWYPGARLFRQTRCGDWQHVIQDLRREILRFQA